MKMPSQIKNHIKLLCSQSAALANMLTAEFGLAKPTRAEPGSELPFAKTACLNQVLIKVGRNNLVSGQIWKFKQDTPVFTPVNTHISCV